MIIIKPCQSGCGWVVCVPLARPSKVLIKEPGSIGGQQFIVEECSESEVYLLDHTAALTIDVCNDCRIFAGPCESRYECSRSCLRGYSSP